MALAQVATDGTLGPKVNLSGSDIQVGADLGQIRGQNLFHSFERFGVQANGKVTFTGPGGLSNVISRVTGGQASSIDGTLASKVPGADVYLVNPSGVVFGPNARLDVPGSFHASTADELRFKDGAVFSALDPSGSQLSVAAPQAFGFLGRTSARIDVNGSTLQIRSGKTLSLTAGDVGITGADVAGAAQSTVSLAAQRGPGQVPVRPVTPAVARDGSIRITANNAGKISNVQVAGAGGGKIAVEGGDVLVDGSSVFSANTGGTNDQTGVDIAAKDITIQGRDTAGMVNGGVATFNVGNGRAGPVRLNADDVRVLGGSVFSIPIGRGGGGAITILADRLTMDDGSIGSPQFFLGAGSSGATTIEATESILLQNGSFISSASFGDQPAGQISIKSGQDVVLKGGSSFSADTLGAGKGGTIVVEAPSLLLDQSRITATSSGSGDAGNVIISSTDLRLVNQGQVLTSTNASGLGGNIKVKTDTLTADDRGNPGVIQAAGLFADTGAAATRDAGSIQVEAQRIELLNGAQISGVVRGSGNGGTIDIKTNELIASGQRAFNGAPIASGIVATASFGSRGNGGNVNVEADRIELSKGAQIFSGTFSSGNGGSVSVDAETIVVTGDFFAVSGILTTAEQNSTGDAGRLSVTSDRLELRDGGQVSGSTFGQGNGQDILVNSDTILITGLTFVDINNPRLLRSGITANADTGSRGNGGTVNVAATERLEIRNGGQVAASTLGAGNGGQVSIVAGEVFIGEGKLGTGITTQAEQSSGGIAGDVIVVASMLQNQGQISSSTDSVGNAGTVVLLTGSLINQGLISSDTTNAGNARGVVIGTDSLRNAGIISSSTFGAGNGGAVVIEAADILVTGSGGITTSAGTSFSGRGGAILIQAKRLRVVDDAQISSGTLSAAGAEGIAIEAGQLVIADSGLLTTVTGGQGNAGVIAITADQMDVRDSGQINSSTVSGGNASTITIAAGRMTLSGDVDIISATTGRGNAGDIVLQARQMEIHDNAQLNTGSAVAQGQSIDSYGRAGRLFVTADSFSMSGGTQISSSSTTNGQAGTVVIAGSDISIGEGATVSSSGSGTGAAGDVVVAADRLQIADASVATSGEGTVGGRINLFANDLIYLLGATVTSSGIEPAAGASVITLTAPTIVLNDSQVTSLTGSGQPLQGSGEARILGDITVISADSIVAASSSVETTGLQTDLGSDLQLATGTFLDADQLLRESCAAQGTARSTFIRTGKGGLPPSPDRPLASVTSAPSPLAGTLEGAQAADEVATLLPCDGQPLEPST